MKKSKLYFAILITVILILVTYKIYAPYTIQDFNAINVKNMETIKTKIENKTKKEGFSFAVVGNIENSISIFDNKILEKIKKDQADFILSTGNNLRNGDESKYRVFYRTLEKLKLPFLTAVGKREIKDGSNENFYKYFGPFYYSFAIKDSYFIFLDTTQNTNLSWQQQWLENELERAQKYNNKFVIMNEAPLKIETENLLDNKNKYMEKANLRIYYQKLFAENDVRAVFSSNLNIYHQQKIDDVDYFISGGAGGDLLLDNEKSFYHYLLITVLDKQVKIEVKELENSPGVFAKIMVNIWVTLQSFFYANYINILLILFIALTIFYFLHREINKEVDYYRGIVESENIENNKKLKIAMFTNNYFPIIGGVPISIQRLAKALRKRGHQVKIFAPDYQEDAAAKEENIIRCQSLYHYQESGLEFPVTNIFSPQIKKNFKAGNFDLVHSHHPFWLGKKGLKLAKKFNLPAAYTYHTRLEKYAHYVPNILFMRKFFANRLSHFLIKHFANKTDAVFAPTKSTKAYLRNVGVSRFIKVMPTGIDFEYYDYQAQYIKKLRQQLLGEADHLLISVSRLSKEKNLYFLLKGIKKVKEKSNLKFKLIIIGSGSEKNNIEDFIVKNELENEIELIGAVDFKEMAKYYLASDLFVFASTTETQGMVLLEAMAKDYSINEMAKTAEQAYYKILSLNKNE